MPTFDVITSSLCLEAAAEDITEYENMARRVEALLKEDGHVILFGNIGEKVYTVGDHSFPSIGIKEDQVKSVWVRCGFSITEWKQKVYPEFPDTAVTGYQGSFMLVARKTGKTGTYMRNVLIEPLSPVSCSS